MVPPDRQGSGAGGGGRSWTSHASEEVKNPKEMATRQGRAKSEPKEYKD